MGRIKSVDVLRTIAIIFIIAIHTLPFQHPSLPVGQKFDFATLINQFARFAVPFFFVLSGYFWAQKLHDEDCVTSHTIKTVKRIAAISFFWSLIYLLPTNIIQALDNGLLGPIKQFYWNLSSAANKPHLTLVQGTKGHLWFLHSLICSLIISAIFVRLGLERLLFFFAIVLYLIGLAAKAYSNTPLGLHYTFNFRNGPFFSLLFFVTGFFLQRRSTSPSWFPIGCAIAIFGFILHLFELKVLNDVWGVSMNQDYVAGTYFFGLGAALMAFSNTKWLESDFLALIGPRVLGIYTSHYVFVDLFAPFAARFAGHALWDLSYIAIVFFTSYYFSRILANYRLTKILVT